MGYDANELIEAMHSAYAKARALNRTMFVIALPSGKLQAIERPGADDVVVVRNIRASRWQEDISEAARLAFESLQDAYPALKRMGEIIREKSPGKPRDPENQFELVDEVIRRFAETGGYERIEPALIVNDQRREWWNWTRLFGIKR